MPESSKPRKRAPGGGRKPTDPASHTVKKSVSLLPATYEHLMQVGGNELSKGVRFVTEFHQETLAKLNKKT
jgi:hypothetical protein